MGAIAAELGAELRARALEGESYRRQDARRPRTVARAALKAQVRPAAQQLARSVRDQVATAIGKEGLAVDLSDHVYGLVDTVVRIAEEYEVDATSSVAAAVQNWRALDPARSPRAGSFDALKDMVGDALDGAEGGMHNSLRLAFGDAFAGMNEAAQRAGGVERYVWDTRKDDAVRAAHAALEGRVCSWDDPPLKASESSSGEDCHAGEDYNCRCRPAPIAPADAGDV